ncbi:hypothetical protein NDI44_12860 [Trichocoleus sp. DQ-A3]|uniref:DUF6615 family protein n=1 Tax=Cyanophyceae TaxID=3028117 RepID=UPI001681E49D|nr:DUF6615 family protein [Coleofasciculus sp. FACHB-125]MBD1900013.1 hypothetical protein [Coleofasciculus sp. FACHB-125]
MQNLYTSNSNFDICHTFCNRAIETWNLMYFGEIAGISISETTLTELNLLEIKRRHPTKVYIKKFSQQDEGKTTGADWEWWIGSNSQWLGIRVQAKRLKDKNADSYSSFNHSNIHGKQVDMLLNDARINRLYSMYCFYNSGYIKTFPSRWNCGTFAQQENFLGCSIADALTVRDILNKNKKDFSVNFSSISYPWHCIVCCQGFRSLGYTDSLPGRAASFIQHISGGLTEEIQLIREEPPSYVRGLLQREATDEGELPEGISGLFVIKE